MTNANNLWKKASMVALFCGVAVSGHAAVTAVVNAANYAGGGVSPGEIVIVYGTGLGPAQLAQGSVDTATNRFRTTVAATRVLFDEVAAPIVYASQTQTSVVVPYSVSGKSSVSVRVEYQGQPAGTTALSVVAAVPGLFSRDSSGTGAGAFFNQDGNLNTARNPARVGEVVVLFGTGEGQTNPAGIDGGLATSPYPAPSQPTEVTIGGRTAQVAYFGAVPGFIAGLFQINAFIPAGTPPGEHAVTVKVGSVTSTPIKPINLYVGGAPPVLSSSFGRPGQKITMNFTDPVEPSAVTAAVFQFPNTLPIPAPIDVVSGSKIAFYVPLIPDNSQAGYVTGNFTVGLKRGDVIVGSLPFRIDPLQPVTDSVNKFKLAVADMARFTRTTLQQQQQIPSMATVARGAETMIDTASAPLTKMADDIAANGFADLRLDVFSTSSPTLRVTRRDLDNMIAMWENDPTLDGTRPRSASQQQAAVARPAGAGCFSESFEYCVTLANTTPAEIATTFGMRDIFHVFRRAVTLPIVTLGVGCKLDPSQMTAWALASAFLPTLHTVACKLGPNKPTKLTAFPVPDPIPVGSINSTGSLGTRIKLDLAPYWTRDFTVDQVYSTAYVSSLRAIIANAASEGCSADYINSLNNLGRTMLSSAQTGLRNYIGGSVITSEETLDACSVDSITTNVKARYDGKTNYDASKNAKFPLPEGFRWGIEGVEPGPSAIKINEKKEMFPEQMFLGLYGPCDPGAPHLLSLFNDYDPISPCMDVQVARPKQEVFVSSTIVGSIRNDSLGYTDVNPPVNVTDTNAYGISKTELGATSSLNVKKSGPNKWQVTQTVSGSVETGQGSLTDTWNNVQLYITHWPGPREVKIHVSSSVSGSCQGLSVNLTGYGRDGSPTLSKQEQDGNNGCPADWTLTASSPQTPNSDNRSVGLDIRLKILGGEGAGFGPGKGTVTTDIELVSQTPN